MLSNFMADLLIIFLVSIALATNLKDCLILLAGNEEKMKNCQQFLLIIAWPFHAIM